MTGPNLLDDFIVDEIKDALNRAKTIPEVNLVVRHYTRHIAAMRKSRKQYFKTMAIQIENLRSHRCTLIRRGKP